MDADSYLQIACVISLSEPFFLPELDRLLCFAILEMMISRFCNSRLIRARMACLRLNVA